MRKAIEDIGGIMPEELPIPKKSLKELEKEKKQLENNEQKILEEIKLIKLLYIKNKYFVDNNLDINWILYNLSLTILKLIHFADLDAMFN